MGPTIPTTPTIHREHPLSRDLIDEDAVKIVRRLHKYGYEAYFVGGCVRDLLLGIKPKDFDIATSARPREIRSLFRNCRVIGRRFRLCHIFFGEKIIEVATFRAEPMAKVEEDAPATPEGASALASVPPPEMAAPPKPMPSRRPAAAPPAGDLRALRHQPRVIVVEPARPDESADFAAGIFDDAPPRRAPAKAPAPSSSSSSSAGDFAAGILDEAPLARAPAPASAPVPVPAPEADLDFEEEPEAEPLRDRAPHGARRRVPRWRRLLEEESPQGYGTEVEDALLRDFTINALFYDVVEDRIIDYTGGMQDLRGRLLKTIGDPDRRIVEDPVRILRAIKAAARLGLTIEPPTYEAMARHRDQLSLCSPRRLLEEILKYLSSGAAAPSFRLAAKVGVVPVLLPELAPYFPPDDPDAPAYRYLEALDRAPREGLRQSVMVGALFYLPACDALARAGLGRPGEAEPHERRSGLAGDGGGAERESSPFAAEQVIDEIMRSFAMRHSLSKRVRAEAGRAVLAQRLLRSRRADQHRRIRLDKLMARDWFEPALELLEVVVDAENLDREVLWRWLRRVRSARGPLGPEGPARDEDREGAPSASIQRRDEDGEGAPAAPGAEPAALDRDGEDAALLEAEDVEALAGLPWSPGSREGDGPDAPPGADGGRSRRRGRRRGGRRRRGGMGRGPSTELDSQAGDTGNPEPPGGVPFTER